MKERFNMTKIYEEFPEITNIKANVLSKKFVNNNTYLILDKTIFMPKNDSLKDDEGYISGHKVLSIEEKKDNIIHLIEGKENRKDLVLSLDKSIRIENLYNASSFCLFKIFYKTYYSTGRFFLEANDEMKKITIKNPSPDFDPYLIEYLINYSIDKGLKINFEKGIAELPGIGKAIHNLICFDNTYKVKSFKIINCLKEDNSTVVFFEAGS